MNLHERDFDELSQYCGAQLYVLTRAYHGGHPIGEFVEPSAKYVLVRRGLVELVGAKDFVDKLQLYEK